MSKQKPAPKARPRKAKTSGQTPVVPQQHGGALQVGNPGNVGGPGRPPSAIRELCRGAFAERVPVLTAIADGEPVQNGDVPLLRVLEHAHCPKCGDHLQPNSLPDALLVSVRGKVSASPGERTKAIDTLGKYGLDARTQLSVDDVKERLRATVALLRAEFAPDVIEPVLARVRLLWAA